MIDPRDFRATLGHFATGVTVVTVQTEEGVQGITVNAFMSVSLKPPLVAICIDERAKIHPTLLDADRFGVSMLRHDQEHMSNWFAGWPGDVAPVYVELGDHPVLADSLAHIVCRITAQHEAGDHTIFVGHVEHLAHYGGEPLLYFRGDYCRMDTLELAD